MMNNHRMTFRVQEEVMKEVGPGRVRAYYYDRPELNGSVEGDCFSVCKKAAKRIVQQLGWLIMSANFENEERIVILVRKPTAVEARMNPVYKDPPEKPKGPLTNAAGRVRA